MSGAAGGAMAGILIANNLVRLREGILAARTAWHDLEPRGLVLEADPDDAARPMLRGRIGEIACEVRIVTDFVHNPHTEVIATPAPGNTVKIGVYPSPGGLLKRVRDWLHHDIEVGDEDFDEAFLVKSTSADAARRLLDATMREHLAQLSGGRLVGLIVTPEKITVMLNNVETDAAALNIALYVAIEAARWRE